MSKVCEADPVKVEVHGVCRIIGIEAILRGWAGGEDEKRRRRIDEMKEGIARNRLERLEKEEDQEEQGRGRGLHEVCRAPVDVGEGLRFR